MYKKLRTFTEDKHPYFNLLEIDEKGLSRGKTANQPWTDNYWPGNKGLIADPYTGSASWNPLRLQREISWQANYQRLKKRKQKVHQRWQELDQEELDHLSPSEKYDLLLGDDSFHLTNTLRDYMYKRGTRKEFAFLTSTNIVGGQALEFAKQLIADPNEPEFTDMQVALPYAIKNRGGLADKFAALWVRDGKFTSFEEALSIALAKARREANNYVLEKKNVTMALWEGICHGWATAAGHFPRPVRTVSFKLNSAKMLRFYPSDIKALSSLLWANSLVQDVISTNATGDGGVVPNVQAGTYIEGLKCREEDPEKDEWGRLYDARPDSETKQIEPRCVGVHPAIYHMALVNLIGKQKRSFVTEIDITEAVNNHPMVGYKSVYFDPYRGDYSSLKKSIRKIDHRDQFRKFRSPEASFIIGVKTTITVSDYVRWPKREHYDSPQKDQLKDIELLYDLELNKYGEIVGGQWRTTETGSSAGIFKKSNYNQPDFFWVISKNWKKFFRPNNENPFRKMTIDDWEDKSQLPPKNWLAAAVEEHKFKYYQTHKYGWNRKCKFENIKTKAKLELPCEFEFDKPRPLVDVVKVLIELSSLKSLY